MTPRLLLLSCLALAAYAAPGASPAQAIKFGDLLVSSATDRPQRPPATQNRGQRSAVARNQAGGGTAARRSPPAR